MISIDVFFFITSLEIYKYIYIWMSSLGANNSNNEETKTTIYSMLTDQPITIPDNCLFGTCR